VRLFTVSNTQLKRLRSEPYIVVAVPTLPAESYKFELPDVEKQAMEKVARSEPISVFCPGEGQGLSGLVGILKPTDSNKFEVVILCDLFAVFTPELKPSINFNLISKSGIVWAALQNSN